MEKESILKKIRKFGTIGYRFSKIAMILSGVLLFCSLLFTIIFALVKRDAILFRSSGQEIIEVNVSGMPIKEEGLEERWQEIIDRGATFPNIRNDYEYRLTNIILDNDIVKIVSTTQEEIFDVQDFSLIFFILSVWLTIEMAVLYYVIKICKFLSVCESPFHENMTMLLKNFNISLIVLTIYSSFGDSLINSIAKGCFAVTMDINMISILAVVMVFGLSVIFKYGAMLQQESDETL